ncbi:hypothetical protein B0H65DRAFT_474671 [Neurospora tetraspora]|uniref:Uncharacterized protein n=1 Tax=Neurospora tetraspora TaxID=94610 RepID=A0AAE0J848_9PEZI|nr:hypothetical protein B0H65DRAFT_474671 [Neurospora tetraspora]
MIPTFTLRVRMQRSSLVITVTAFRQLRLIRATRMTGPRRPVGGPVGGGVGAIGVLGDLVAVDTIDRARDETVAVLNVVGPVGRSDAYWGDRTR